MNDIFGTEPNLVSFLTERKEYYSSYYKHSFALLSMDGRILLTDCRAIGSSYFTGEESRWSNDNYKIYPPKLYDGLMRVQNKNGLWGFVTAEGQMVIPCIYKAAHEFANGVAAVKDGSKWGYIDTTGAYMIQPQYSDAQDFNAYGLAEVQSGSQWNVIDRNNTLVYFEGNQQNQLTTSPQFPSMANPAT